MGQIVAFPLQPRSYPDLTASLSVADNVLLLAIRWWVEAERRGCDPIPGLREKLSALGAADAAWSVHALMVSVVGSVRGQIDIHGVSCPTLSGDEKQLLHSAGLAQAGNDDLAEQVLERAMLSAEGAALAMGALAGLGRLLTMAKLFLTGPMAPTQRAGTDLRATCCPTLRPIPHQTPLTGSAAGASVSPEEAAQ